MNIRFDCPGCRQPARLDLPASSPWQCPSCDQLLPLPEESASNTLASCVICGNRELYKKKDFPHWLGMSVLTGACVGFLLGNALRQQYLAWGILLGSALFDGLLYLWVKDVAVCYRCDTHLRGFDNCAELPPHDQGVAERYRQERARRELLEQQEARARGADSPRDSHS